MNSLPQVSIAMISYQQKEYIVEALQSVIEQDYPNLQIVVSDDHSTDGTAQLIAEFADRYPGRIIALLNDNRLGITKNSNRALERCTGDYIAFIGGDDVFLPGKISRQVAWFEERKERVLCGHQVEVFYESGARAPHPFLRMMRVRRGKGAAGVIRRGAFAACSIMVRADKIPRHGFDENVPLVSDYVLWAEVLANGGEYGAIPGTYARYRRHGANVSGDVPRLVEDTVRALEIIQNRYPQYKDECQRARARFQYYAMGAYHLEEGRRRQACQAFLHAIRIEPTYPRPWIGLLKSLAS
jgi:glycosyltransferase involved in cell wall biosynthesis